MLALRPLKFSARLGTFVPKLNEVIYGSEGPFYYEVVGLPPGEVAWIAGSDLAENWQIVRLTNGIPGDWEGEYETSDEALKALQKEFPDA